MVLKKNFFSFFYPHTLTFRLNRLTVSHKKCEGKCEGKLSPLTLTLTLTLTLPKGKPIGVGSVPELVKL